MPELGKNLCTPARIYGPPSNTLFCGCSIKSFSSSAGWNEQASSLTVELVENPCSESKIWWDETLTRQTGTIADPGFSFPEPGCAVYFRIEEDPDGSTELERGGFEYAGVVVGWTEGRDANGYPTYSVRLSDPRAVLENTQVIVNDHPGATSGVWNLINAYAFVESLGSSCTSSPAGGFGGFTTDNTISNIANERGMVWSDVRCAINTLTSTTPRSAATALYNDYCVDNRLVYVGPNAGEEGYGVIEKDATLGGAFASIPNANLNAQYYYVDLTELPFSPSYYRIDGPNISLMEIISQVCKDAGCDYYIELLPVIRGSEVVKIIKLRVAIRQSQPQLGRLDQFIAAKQAADAAAGGGIISYTKGEEVRNDETSIYLMGGKKREAHIVNSSQMLPYWGQDSDGALIQATITDEEYFVRLDLESLNISLYNPFATRYNWISERELRAALRSMDTWKEVVFHVANDFADHLTSLGFRSCIDGIRLLGVRTGGIPAHAAPKHPLTIESSLLHNANFDLDKIYDFVKTYADEYYGKKFLINSDEVCYSLDAESNKFRYSHEPSPEGCWVNDNVGNVLGLVHNTPAADVFRDEVGKYGPIIRYPFSGVTTMAGAHSTGLSGVLIKADPTQLNDENYIVTSSGTGYIWVRGEVDSSWISGTPLVPTSNTLSFLVSIDAPVTYRVSNDADVELRRALEGIALLSSSGLNFTGNPPSGIEISSSIYPCLPPAIAPDAAMVPFVNNVKTYGPWGIAGLPGQVIADTDEGLTPWDYGGDSIMNSAAIDKVTNAVTQMRKSERGSVTVAGIPNIPIGAELMSVDTGALPLSQSGQKYVGSRTADSGNCVGSLYYYYVNMNAWSGVYGPNVTSVNVSWGGGGFTTEYQFSTYTPQYGRFNKDNASRLKEVGQTRLKMMRNIRSRNRIKTMAGSSYIKGKKMVDSQVGQSDRAPKSAHHFYIGRYTSSKRPEINTQSAREARFAFSSEGVYGSTAMMTLDGLMRPISRSGDGNLSPYIRPTGEQCSHNLPEQADPPMARDPISWAQKYLDPVSNSGDTLPLERDGSATPVGHDIEVLGRGSTAPPSGWAIPEGEAGGAGGYTADYRYFALRGPMMIQSWGHDMMGKPVPNKADTVENASDGIFTTGALQDKFLDNWLQEPKTWPVAPLDLVLDRKRGVWTTPQPPRIIRAQPTGGECVSSATGNRLYPILAQKAYDSVGNLISYPDDGFAANWPWTAHAPSGVGAMPIYYDPVDCAHYMFPVNRFDARVTGSELRFDVKQIHFKTGFTEYSWDTGSLGEECNRILTITASGAGGTGTISDADWCDHDSGYSESLENLVLGTGLCPSSDGATTTRIDVCMTAEGNNKTNVCADGDSVGPKLYNKLIFNGNLSTTVDSSDPSGCTIMVSGLGGGGTLIDTTVCDNATVAVVNTAAKYDHLTFGKGLFVSAGAACQYTISTDIKVENIDVCDKVGPVVNNTFQTLVLGSGMRATQDEVDCQYRLDTFILASGKAEDGTPVPDEPTVGKSFTRLNFQGNLVTEILDDCVVQVSGKTTLPSISGLNVCSRDMSSTNDLMKRLAIGTGLVLSNWPSTSTTGWRIDSAIKIQDMATCTELPAPSITSPVNFETITFGDGLAVSEGAACEYIIDSDIWIRNINTPDKPTNNLSGLIRVLEVGEGIYLSNQETNCNYRISTRLLEAWGGEPCGGSRDVGGEVTGIIFGSGITSTYSDSVMNVSAPKFISASGNACYGGINPAQFETLIFSGLDVSKDAGYSDCTYLIKHEQLVGKTETTCEISSPTPLAGETVIEYAPFTKLNIGSGIRLIAEGSCEYTIHGGLKFADAPCGSSNTFNKWYPKAIIGSGLNAQADADNCSILISNPVTVEAASVVGQSITHLADGSSPPAPGPGGACAPGWWGGVTWTQKGPYPFRIAPKSTSNLYAGGGIGITADCYDLCEAVIFNNHRDYGYDAGCDAYKVYQVNRHDYSQDFKLSAGSENGGVVDSSDASLNTSISLNEGGGAWECTFVKSIIIGKDGDGFVTGVDYTCGSIAGVKTCASSDAKHWITSIDCGCS